MVLAIAYRVALLLALAHSSLAGEAGSLVQCAQWSQGLAEMQKICCQAGCPMGFPTECSKECAGVMSQFLDDCEGMFDYLGLTDNPLFQGFVTQCQSLFVPTGIATCDQGDGCDESGALVQFVLDTKGIDVPDGAHIQICGSFNEWCSSDRRPPLTMLKQSYPASSTKYTGAAHLPEGTWLYKYRYVEGEPGDGNAKREGTWEDVPEACGIAGPYDSNRVFTVVTGNAGLDHENQGAGLTNEDTFSACGLQNACDSEPQLDVNFLGKVNDRSGDHKISLGGDAHCEVISLGFTDRKTKAHIKG
jgi:hypothetical protein